MNKKTRDHISIRLNPDKDAEILRWYESLPHYERSGHVKDALNQYIGGRNHPAPTLYRKANSSLNNFSSSNKYDTINTVIATEENPADEIQNNIDEWKDLV